LLLEDVGVRCFARSQPGNKRGGRRRVREVSGATWVGRVVHSCQAAQASKQQSSQLCNQQLGATPQLRSLPSCPAGWTPQREEADAGHAAVWLDAENTAASQRSRFQLFLDQDQGFAALAEARPHLV